MSKFLFTNLWSDDLGLPTRTVPIAVELKNKGHEVCFCNPTASPSVIIQEAGLSNLLIKCIEEMTKKKRRESKWN